MVRGALARANIDGGAERNEELLDEHRENIFYLD